MNKYIHYIGILAAFLYGMTACESEPIVSVSENEYSFSLSTNSRATTDGDTPSDPGVEDLNENKLDFVYLFFFNADGLVHQTNKLPVSSNKVSFKVDNDKLKENESYQVYALANRELSENDSPTTIDALNQLSATEISIKEEGVQSSFVMSGQAEIASLAKGNNGTITLYRSAAKISLLLDVATFITVGEGDDAITYKPVLTEGEGENTTNAMRVTLHKGNKNGRVDATADFVALEDTERAIGKKITIKKEGKADTYVADHIPFYSYPTAWDTEATADNECWLELMIIWKNKSTEKFAPYYYRIPVDKDAKKLLRNHHYQINADVAILGSVKPEDAKELSSTFTLESWNECALNPKLKKYSYLWVENTDIIMNNSNQVTINFASSSDVTVTINSVKRDTPTDNKNPENKDYNVTYSDIVNVSAQDGKITVNVNRRTDDNDKNYLDNYRPWRITFTISNKDGDSKMVTVEHRPAIYVVGNFNGDGLTNRFVYGVNGSGNGQNGKDVYSDKWYSNQQNGVYWLGSLYNLNAWTDSNAKNRNMNQYKINISVLGIEHADKKIGDPRTSEPVTLSYMTKRDASNNSLDNYHPTDENAMDVIAPSFIISSSWSITQPMDSKNFQNALRRCASYQENGYPAGRWRLPTQAEIEFVMSLSNKGYIPALFDGTYFDGAGNGYTSSGDSKDSYGVRCVYDLWFWGDAAPLTGTAANTFTWGDHAY